VTRFAVCADVGSTYTKVAVVDLDGGRLAATAEHPTTVGTDVLDGLDAAGAAATAGLGLGTTPPLYVCSSAGGGLRLAVVGYERLITAKAGRLVGLSAGAHVVHVAAGPLDGPAVADLRAARPDVVLLVGGTDGGDAEVLLHNATRLARTRLRLPVVAAGNADARAEVVATLAGGGVPVTATDNVLPRLGVLAPGPARAAIRDAFLRHVIGGKRLSRGRRFASLVRGATPEVVLTAVELLADAGAGGDLAVIDVGGATTDVYSALVPDAEQHGGVSREATGNLWRARTVEGDLGVRWSAPGVVAAASAERLLSTEQQAALAAAAEQPSPAGDLRLAAVSAVVAMRRHARRDGAVPPRGAATPAHMEGGRDLRDVRLLIGSGGVLRHATPGDAQAVLAAVLGDAAGGWVLPRAAETVIDRDYVLAAAGLLAGDEPAAALGLLSAHLRPQSPQRVSGR
jgi:uncharacterized protein (TIGR01319 family)